jgi:hypothetical protein
MEEDWKREDDWFWEGNIQESVINYMKTEEGFTILSPGHPAPAEQGLEILAERSQQSVTISRLVVIRGWPSPLYTRGSMAGQPRSTRPEIVARGWMAQAVLDIALGRGGDPDLDLSLAIPAMASYVRYIQRLRWFMAAARVTIYMVSQEGNVSVTPPGSAPVNYSAQSALPNAVQGQRRKLGLPGASRLHLPLLHALVMGGGESSRTDAILSVARWFPEVTQPPPAEIGQRVSDAHSALQSDGLTEISGRGVWSVTPKGRELHDRDWDEWQNREEK